MDIYAQNILDRYKKPYYKKNEMGRGAKSCVTNGVSSFFLSHKEANHSCGDVVEIGIEFEDGRVKEYQFSGNGCAISMASADMLGDVIEEMTEGDILNLTKDELYQVLGIEISVRRSKCALLPLLAIQNGILQHQKKTLKSWKDYHI